MAKKLQGKKIACVATNGFEYAELTEPKKAFESEGATVHVISIEPGKIQGETKGKPAGVVSVDMTLDQVDPEDYDALLLPGGLLNPDSLRQNDSAITFVSHFVDENKPIAAICHGPWTLINAHGVSGKRMTSWPSLKVDLENAGAIWEDSEVVHDGMLVTSRKPDDISAFNRESVALFAEAEA